MNLFLSSAHTAPAQPAHRVTSSSRPWHPAATYLPIALLLALLSLVQLASPLAVNAQATDASITGTVTDTQGAALPEVSIAVRNTTTGVTRTIVSNASGQYRLAALPPGEYDLTAQHEGFATTQVKGIELSVGLEFQRDVALTVGGVQQAVSVTAQQPLIERSSSEAGSDVITQVQIDSLPIPGRQPTQLALLLPGTGTDSTRTQRPDANVGAGDVNVASTNYLVDGLTNMISGQGDPRDNIPQAAVQEFKVITSQAPAEYGGRSGGVVTLATKSGGNQLHGEAFEFFRDHYINRVDYYTQAQHDSDTSLYPIEPFSRNQFGGAAGGPILKDRLHYFGSFERLDDKEYFTVAPGGAGATPAVQADYAALQGSFRNGSLQNSYFGRLDWQIDPKHVLFLKFFEQNPSIFYCLGCAGGNNAAFSSGDTSVRGWTWAAGHTWLISPRVVNQLNVQVAQDWQSSLPSAFNTPSQTLLNNASLAVGLRPGNVGVLAGGSTTYSFPSLKWGFYPGTQFHPFYQEAVEALTYNTGRHTFKFGGSILNQPRKTQAAATPLGSWTFAKDIYFNPNDPNFNWASLSAANPTKWTTTFPTIPYTDYNVLYGFYAQDEWKLRPSLTLNLGVRYDLQTKVWRNSLYQGLYPTPLPFVDFKSRGDHNNVAPRLGFAWDPRNDGKTVVRGGFGIVYTANQNTSFGGEVTTTRQTSITVSSSTKNGVTTYVPYPDPYNGKGYQSAIASTPPNITINANNISNPPVYTSSLGISRQLVNNLALTIDGLYTHITEMPITVNINSPVDPVNAPKVLPLPAWGQINQTQPIGTYGYRALYVRLDKRYSHRYQYTVSYTLAKQNDNYNNSTAITDYYHEYEDLGPSAVDRRNNLVLSGSALARYGITVGGIYTVRSSLPFSAQTGVDNNADGAITDYVPGTLKNQHSKAKLLAEVNAWRAAQATPLAALPLSQIQSNFYNQFDARISKQFSFTERYRLQLIGQLFNVFGKDNFGGVGVTQQTNASATTFGEILSAYPRQQGELAVRFLF
jgi:outer membrane receptor protein involved in Fe transport